MKKRNQGDSSLKERERLKAKISGLNSQLEALTERLSFLPKSVSAGPFFKQMEKLELLKKDLEDKLIRDGSLSRPSTLSFVKEETFRDFANYWEKFLLTANDEMKKKIVQKFVRRVEVGKDELKIHWLVDEEHYQEELALTANSSFSWKNEKLCVLRGSHSLINGALDRIRTYDLSIRNRLLYPAELPVRIVPRKRKNPLIPRSL